jgi:hypothetical protein
MSGSVGAVRRRPAFPARIMWPTMIHTEICAAPCVSGGIIAGGSRAPGAHRCPRDLPTLRDDTATGELVTVRIAVIAGRVPMPSARCASLVKRLDERSRREASARTGSIIVGGVGATKQGGDSVPKIREKLVPPRAVVDSCRLGYNLWREGDR